MLCSNTELEKQHGRELDQRQELDECQSRYDDINPWNFAVFKKDKAIECLGLGETTFMAESIVTELQEFFEFYAKANPGNQKKLCDNLLMAMAKEAQDFYDDNETKDEFLESD